MARRNEEGALLTLAFAAKVSTAPRRVWRALASPVSAADWLPGFEGWLDPPPEHFAPGAIAGFRARLRDIPVTGELRVREVTRGLVRIRLRLGLLGFDARFSVAPEAGDENTTRVGLAVSVSNEVALVSGSLDRFAVRQLASQIAEGMLGALSAHVEKASAEPFAQ